MKAKIVNTIQLLNKCSILCEAISTSVSVVFILVIVLIVGSWLMLLETLAFLSLDRVFSLDFEWVVKVYRLQFVNIFVVVPFALIQIYDRIVLCSSFLFLLVLCVNRIKISFFWKCTFEKLEKIG